MGYIYLRTNKINGKKYVGQTIDIDKRQREWNCFLHHYAGKAIYNARKKYGADSFDFEILIECQDDEMNKWEMYYIEKLNTKVPYGYNMTDGGEGMNGCSISDETRTKMSEAKKGKTPWNKGKKNIYSEETKKKMGIKNKGKKLSEDTKKKISKVLKGRKLSEEWKKRISESSINNKFSKPVLQIDKNTNEIIRVWRNARELQRQFNYNNSSIYKCCQNKPHFNTAYGFKWKYAV